MNRHRGQLKRFHGPIPDHYSCNVLPLWLAPDQVRVITLNDDEALINYAQPIVAELRANMVRGDSDFGTTPFKAKISKAEQRECFPPSHVVGYGWSSRRS